MISTTLSGLVFPKLAPVQMSNFRQDPLGYVSALTSIQKQPEYQDAMVERISEVAQKGRDFVEDMVVASSWYDPPSVGQHVDTWA